MLKILRTIYGTNRVCGIDLVHGAPPRVVLASRAKGRVIFERVDSVPEGTETVAGLPPRISLIRRLESPFSSCRKTRRVLGALLDIQMPFPLEDCYAEFTMLKTKPGGVKALASAVRKQDLHRFVADLRSVSFDPAFIDVEGVALWEESLRILPAAYGSARIAVLKLETEGSTLVLGSADEIISSHSLTSLDPVYIKRLLVAAFGLPSEVDWRICGGLALGDSPGKFIEGLGSEWKGRILCHDEPDLFLARALANRVLVGGPDLINLRQGDDAHERIEESARGKLVALSIVLAGCGLLLAALSLGSGLMMDIKIRSLDRIFTDRAVLAAGGSLGGAKGLDALQRAEKAVAGKLRRSRPLLAPFEPSPADILREIGGLASKQNLLIEYASISRDMMVIEGIADSWDAPELLKSLVSAKGYQAELERNESLAEERVRFKISAGEQHK